MNKDQNKLLQTLVGQNLLSSDVAEELRKRAVEEKRTLEELMIEDKLIDEEKLNAVKAELLEVTAADLKGKDIPDKVLKLIPREVAENYQMVAFQKIGKELHVGLVNPQNFKAIEAVDFLAQKSDLKVKYYIISDGSFKDAFRKYEILGE